MRLSKISQEADIVVVASNLFKSDVYLDNLRLLACATELPAKDGRHFNAHLDKCTNHLKSQTDLLQDEDSSAVMGQIKKAEKEGKHSTSFFLSLLQSDNIV